MMPSTRPNPDNTDEFGIERTTQDNPGFVDKYRQKWPWFDHIMRMNERYSQMGGNQYAAGITYFSVLSMFPILMLAFAIIGFVLASRPDVVTNIQEQITSTVSGELGASMNNIIDVAIAQRNTVAGVGTLAALWSGLGWMNNLRYGVSKMWKIDPTDGNFVVMKLKDLLGLILLFFIFTFTVALTAVGTSGAIRQILDLLRVDETPMLAPMLKIIALTLGLVANFLLFFWLIAFLPRTRVPRRSAARAALIGAVAFEIFKQVGSLFFSNALTNPAGVAFGPIIGVMVLLYFMWRILLYCSAWAATTQESMKLMRIDAPEPAIIRVRHEVSAVPEPATSAKILGAGAAAGFALGAVLLGRKKK